jgi:predicted phage terminase large subunit-like protein
VYRRKVKFPDLKRAVRELAVLHRAKVVLIEDKASGSSLIQELRAEHFSIVQEAPALDGDKVMRLHAQTAKIEGGFVLFPKEAHWLEVYLHELLSFPNSKNDDPGRFHGLCAGLDHVTSALAWLDRGES